MSGLRHKTFHGPYRQSERVRLEAEAYASDIGAEQVVSIVEHGGLWTGLTVVVWYHGEFDELENSLKRQLATER